MSGGAHADADTDDHADADHHADGDVWPWPFVQQRRRLSPGV